MVYLVLHPLIFLPNSLLETYQYVRSLTIDLLDLFFTKHYRATALISSFYFNSKYLCTGCTKIAMIDFFHDECGIKIFLLVFYPIPFFI